MGVGPEFGPIAGVCVALIARARSARPESILALAVGFPLGIVVTYLASLLARATGVGPEVLADGARPLTAFVSHPDATSVVNLLVEASTRRRGR